MSSWQRALICLSVLLVLALLGPASALAGGSAGDQQYIDPLGGQNPNPTSHHSSSGSSPTTPAASTSSSTPTSQTFASSTSSSTGTTAAGSGTSSTASSSSANGADPGGKTLPLTGFDAWAGAFVGLGLLGTGLAVRRAARRAE